MRRVAGKLGILVNVGWLRQHTGEVIKGLGHPEGKRLNRACG